MIRAEITRVESLLQNLDTWCYEVGSVFEQVNREAALEFVQIAGPQRVVDLGCGDGASMKFFAECGITALGVDINRRKLENVPGYTVVTDMLSFLKSQPIAWLDNIYTHHALEHCVEADKVIQEIGRTLAPGGYYYAVVPAHDTIHSVHHVVFESAEELLPPGLEPIFVGEQTRNETEFKCIARKSPL